MSESNGTGKPSPWPSRLLLAALFLSGSLIYTYNVKHNPPGFHFDESSIAYNAFTISRSAHDEHGIFCPLYFRAFGEYKNPTYLYLLAALFRLCGPSITLARLLSATAGLLTSVLLALLAHNLTGRRRVGAAVMLATLLTPWLFEASREVFEVAIYPLVLGLFLLLLQRACRNRVWRLMDCVGLGVGLGLLTYTYSTGRLYGPLLGVGLMVFMRGGNGRRVVLTLLWYGVLLIPLIIFNSRHPGALIARFNGITYITPQSRWGEVVKQFIWHYLLDINPWSVLATGGTTNAADHVPGIGSFLAGAYVVSVLGLYLIIKEHRREAWWQFILYALVTAVVPAALTEAHFPQLRLITVPVLLQVVSIPAWAWLLAGKKRPAFTSSSASDGGRVLLKRKLIAYLMVVAILLEGGYFLLLFHRAAASPARRREYDTEYEQKIFLPAISTPLRPIYLDDPPALPAGYIQTFWYAVLHGVPIREFVRLPPEDQPPSGALVITIKEEVPRGHVLAQSERYTLYIADYSISKATSLAGDLQYLPPPYQKCGYFIYRLYSVALGRAPRYTEFTQEIEACDHTASPSAPQEEHMSVTEEREFADYWTKGREFTATYGQQTDEELVAALVANAGVSLSDEERRAMIERLSSGRASRGEVVREIADREEVYGKEFDRGYVLMHYFGYLKRNPADAPDRDLSGYDFWVKYLRDTRSYRGIREAFMNSQERREKTEQN